MKRTLAFALFLFGLGCCVHQVAGCQPVPLTHAQAAAEGAYGAALLQCVDDAQTLAESKACRARVDAEWHVVQTPTKEGGR
jgi:hypothetical protein